MKRSLLVFLFLLSGPILIASHIVGGEFEFVYKGTHASGLHRYNISLILYFDRLYGSPGALDPYAAVRIFRKSDNAIMVNALVLDLLQQSAVQYKRPECSSGSSIATDRLYYTYMRNGVQAEILLNPTDFTDPEGYYISWERCCRNYNISNIYSEDPNTGASRYAGQTFYLEFPPLMKDGAPFVNSSPRLFRPLSDYACPGRLYTVDFSGVDPDGDSLVYTMVVPLNTKSGDALPPFDNLPRPGPYPQVTYRAPFSPTNIMAGLPDLSISQDGVLSVIPQYAGLYVFAVQCDEYRNGEKIGSIRRDFQLLVLSNCPMARPPVVEGKKRNDNTFQRSRLDVSFPSTGDDSERCIDIRVSDPDASVQNEDIEILAVAVNFENKVLKDILPEVPRAILSNGNSQMFSICFPQCSFTDSDNYEIDIVVLNESCGGALMDTIRVAVNVINPPNSPPVWTPSEIDETVTEGGAPFVVSFTGTDADGEMLDITPPAFASEFEKYGFSWQVKSTVPGRVDAELTWNTECDRYDFSVKRDFEFDFLLNDGDMCDITPADTLTFKLKRRIEDFHDPVIEYEPNPTLKKITISEKIYNTLRFNTLVSDKDNDKLEVSAVGKDFELPEYGASYPARTLTGNTSVPATLPFSWYLNCDKINPNQQKQFNFYLIVTDRENMCGYHLADTLDVTVNVLPPDNAAPQLAIDGHTEETEITMTVGDDLIVPVVGTDTDLNPQDLLTLELLDADGTVIPDGFTFTSTPSNSPVLGTLSWTPGCEIFNGKEYENDYRFTFRVLDNRCFNPKGDTLAFRLKIKDREQITTDFIPPNVITPNKTDDLNSFFAMVRLENGELVNILPEDNCAGRFVSIMIMNRWGREVFSSNDRDFRWYADGEPSGVYFYLLKFTNREYKGVVSVISGGESQANR